MTDDEQTDRQLVALIWRGLTLPRERVDALQQQIADQIAAEADEVAWTAFREVMTHLSDRWGPVRYWTSRPWGIAAMGT